MGEQPLPAGLVEAIALEAAAALEHEQRADRLWAARNYVEALAEYRRAEEAHDRCNRLEHQAIHGEQP